MTYLETKDKLKSDFKKFIVNNLSKIYSIESDNSMMEFEINNTNNKNAIVCYSSKKSDIDQDYQTLIDSGLQPRYNTSIPKLLQNIYNYYNLEKNNGYSLLIYIDRFKTHVVLIQDNQLFESRYIHIGLNYFISRLSKLASGNLPTAEERSTVLHFLENYGISKTKNKFEFQDGFPYENARLILNELSSIMMNQLKDSINNFSNIPSAIGNNDFSFGGVYIGGPGSHIKNMDRLIRETIGDPVEKLNSITTTSFKKINDSKRHILTRVKENYILYNKKRSENNLKDVQDKIQEQKKAIEMSKSPESAKYRLVRLDISMAFFCSWILSWTSFKLFSDLFLLYKM
jgi:Tfp pilus assembly PilM family ATPase